MSDECKDGLGCPDCGPSSTKRTPDAISARLSKVSDGPWMAWDRGIGYEVHGPEGEPINSGHRETFTKGDAQFIAMAPGDVAYLLDLARKQAAALEAMRELAAKFDATQSCDIAKRDDLQFDLGYSAGRRSAGSILRAALEPTP